MFLKLVQAEIERARKKHGNIHSAHEGLGILEEEFWELKLEVFKRYHDKQAMLSELVQVAAMCAKMAQDICLVEYCDETGGKFPE